jgi:hypothetical protein
MLLITSTWSVDADKAKTHGSCQARVMEGKWAWPRGQGGLLNKETAHPTLANTLKY